jgi:hypothetical protein
VTLGAASVHHVLSVGLATTICLIWNGSSSLWCRVKVGSRSLLPIVSYGVKKMGFITLTGIKRLGASMVWLRMYPHSVFAWMRTYSAPAFTCTSQSFYSAARLLFQAVGVLSHFVVVALNFLTAKISADQSHCPDAFHRTAYLGSAGSISKKCSSSAPTGTPPYNLRSRGTRHPHSGPTKDIHPTKKPVTEPPRRSARLSRLQQKRYQY